MKSFTERNPVTIGVVVIALIAAGTTAALALNGGAFKDRYTVQARFSDTAGLRTGDKVRVAGIPAGQVGSIREHDGRVDVSLEIDEGIELPGDVQAEVVVETLLGSKHVRLSGGRDWDHPLAARDVITDTVTPTEVLDIGNTGAPLLEETDAAAIDDLLGKIERVTEGQRGNVGEIVDGLNRLTKAVNARQAEARSLIRSSRTVTNTLAERDEDLLKALDDVNVVLDGLAKRRVQLATLLDKTEATARKTADLVGENRAQVDAILQELHEDLKVVERNQQNLAESLSGLSNAISGFASIGYSGKDEVPNTWANMYTQLIGPVSPDALLGSCGLLDDAFDVLLGPDPVTDCFARTGPLPGATSGSQGPSAADPLEALYGPLAGEGGG